LGEKQAVKRQPGIQKQDYLECLGILLADYVHYFVKF